MNGTNDAHRRRAGKLSCGLRHEGKEREGISRVGLCDESVAGPRRYIQIAPGRSLSRRAIRDIVSESPVPILGGIEFPRSRAVCGCKSRS